MVEKKLLEWKKDTTEAPRMLDAISDLLSQPRCSFWHPLQSPAPRVLGLGFGNWKIWKMGPSLDSTFHMTSCFSIIRHVWSSNHCESVVFRGNQDYPFWFDLVVLRMILVVASLTVLPALCLQKRLSYLVICCHIIWSCNWLSELRVVMFFVSEFPLRKTQMAPAVRCARDSSECLSQPAW